MHSAERGEGCDIIIFAPPENCPIYRVTILHVTRYQLMSWIVLSGRLILPDGLSRCERDWFAVTRDARRVTPLHLQKPVTRRLQRVTPLRVSNGDALSLRCVRWRHRVPRCARRLDAGCSARRPAQCRGKHGFRTSGQRDTLKGSVRVCPGFVSAGQVLMSGLVRLVQRPTRDLPKRQ